MLYNLQGLLSEKFILVEFPGVLFAGFYFCLKQLQELSKKEEGFAFSSLIAPSTASSSPVSSPPKYAKEDCFSFNCNVLQSPERLEKLLGLYLKPNMVAKNERHMKEFIEVLKQKTTLDGGQAAALCENLCRGLAFTQGPPGTGKILILVSLFSPPLNGFHRQNIPWSGTCQSYFSIKNTPRPKANRRRLFDQPCSRCLFR